MLENFPSFEKNPTVVGPWGGQYGSLWDDGVYSGVRQIVLTHGACIDSIQIEYDQLGSPVLSEKHGVTGGYKVDKVKLDYPEEFLTSLHGYYGNLYEGDPVCVRSLTFESNKKTYGPFGIQQGTFFSFPVTGHIIVGFHGRSGWYLDAIGVHMKPLYQKTSSNFVVYSGNYAAGGGAKTFGYSVIQRHVGNNPNPSSITFPKQSSSSSSSSSSSGEEMKDKFLSLPSTKEKTSPDPGEPVTYGPWGGNGGAVFDDGIYTGIRQIYLSRNVSVVWIKVLYEQNGLPVWGRQNGGPSGFETEKIIFDYPFEVLTNITGFYGPTIIYGLIVIKSLTFHTTKGKYGPYGEEQGTPFSTNLKEGTIVGFHGRKGLFVDAIGVHAVKEKVTPRAYALKFLSNVDGAATYKENPKPLWPSKNVVNRPQFEEIFYGVVKEPAPCEPGPWGGESGKPWDDGVYTGIRQIFVTISEVICSIQMEYDQNGQSVWSVKHGGNSGKSGTNTHRIILEYPHEVLTCISGYYGPINRDDHTKVIRSLKFYTSRGKFGPFGEEIGTFFTSTRTEGKIVGFHGRSGMYLDAIGVHMQHWLGGYATLAWRP